jgi:hypothetical protein
MSRYGFLRPTNAVALTVHVTAISRQLARPLLALPLPPVPLLVISLFQDQ